MDTFPLRQETRQKCHLPLLFNIVFYVLASASLRQEKEIKMHTDQRVELKFSLFVEDIIIYAEKPTKQANGIKRNL